MAIKNKQEYDIVFDWLVKFTVELEALENANTCEVLPPLMKKAMIESYKEQIRELEEEIKAYADECTERRILAGLPPEPFEVG